MEHPYQPIFDRLDELNRKLEEALADRQNEHGLDKFKFIRFEPACETLGVSAPTLRKYTADRKIACHKRGHYVYYKIDDLNEFIEKGRREAKKGLA